MASPVAVPYLPVKGKCRGGDNDPLCLVAMDAGGMYSKSCDSFDHYQSGPQKGQKNPYTNAYPVFSVTCKSPLSAECKREQNLIQDMEGMPVDSATGAQGYYHVLSTGMNNGIQYTLCKTVPAIPTIVKGAPGN